jgi:hypothetical protein
MVFLPLRFVLYPQLRAAYHWRLARKALDRDNLPAAQVHLKYCAQGWPASGEVQFLMARTCRRGGDFAEARTYLQEADRLRWDKGLVDLEYYLMEAQAGMVGPVEKKLERYLATRPGEEEVILEGLAIGYLQVNPGASSDDTCSAASGNASVAADSAAGFSRNLPAPSWRRSKFSTCWRNSGRPAQASST